MNLRRTCLPLLVPTLASACTHWAATEVYGERQELARRPIGAPQVAETSESSMATGFLGASQNDGRGTTVMSGGLSGNNASLKRTHCIQQAEIDYVQPIEVVPEEQGRFLDVGGGLLLGLLGLVLITSASVADDSVFDPGDPFYAPPDDQTAVYATGAVMIAGGVGWIIGSYAALPSGPMPARITKERRWTESTFVEATGCGLVPADRREPPMPRHDDESVEARLQRLDDLHRQGLVSDREYQRKRQEILDAL